MRLHQVREEAHDLVGHRPCERDRDRCCHQPDQRVSEVAAGDAHRQDEAGHERQQEHQQRQRAWCRAASPSRRRGPPGRPAPRGRPSRCRRRRRPRRSGAARRATPVLVRRGQDQPAGLRPGRRRRDRVARATDVLDDVGDRALGAEHRDRRRRDERGDRAERRAVRRARDPSPARCRRCRAAGWCAGGPGPSSRSPDAVPSTTTTSWRPMAGIDISATGLPSTTGLPS